MPSKAPTAVAHCTADIACRRKRLPTRRFPAFCRTRSGVMGKSRIRRPVATAKALAVAAAVGAREPSTPPTDGSSGRSISTTSTRGISGKRTIGYPIQSRDVIDIDVDDYGSVRVDIFVA
jgi:hypothetical protein